MPITFRTLNRVSSIAALCVLTLPAIAAEGQTKTGLTYTSEDGRFSARIGGRIQLDSAWYREDLTPLENGAELRRGRVFLKGTLFSDWEYKLETDLAQDQLDITDAWLLHKATGLVIGQFKVPFSLNQITSSNVITFMERSVDGFREGRRLGAGWFRNGNAWSFGSAVFGQAIGDDTVGRQGFGAAIRGVYRPWQTADGDLVHIGISSFFQQPSDDRKEIRVRQRPWSHVTDVRFVDTGVLDQVNRERGLNLEMSAVLDSFSLQGEYVNVNVARDAGLATETFNAWYVFGSWMTKGSKRGYDRKTGAYSRGKVESGTWEFGLRYSVFDLQSATIRGGRQQGMTLATNYYFNPRFRVMLNLANIDTVNSEVTLGGETEDIAYVQMRIAFDF